MKRIVIPPTAFSIKREDREPEDVVSEVSLSRLLDQGLLSLSREMKNLTILSSRGKLDPPDARDLRDTVKLLFELKDREIDLLNGLTDEELQKQLDEKILKEKENNEKNNASASITES